MHLFGAGQSALTAPWLSISRYLASKLIFMRRAQPHCLDHSQFLLPPRQAFKQLLALVCCLLSLMTLNSAYAADDYSDAPATYGTPTHLIAGSLKLGSNAPDSETSLAPLDGTGDDASGIDDEDGVAFFPVLVAGTTGYFFSANNISASGTGTLHAWIDFDKNGAFTATEYKAVAVTAGTLAGPLNWSTATIGAAGTTYARFRFTSTPLTDNLGTTAVDERATAAAADGEVEDYAITISPTIIPASYCRAETLVANGNFSTNPVPTSTGWGYANAPYDALSTGAYNYIGNPNTYYNSTLTGGLYDNFNPAGNPATGIYSALQESDGPSAAVAYHFPHALLPGTHYYSFDLSSRFNQTIFADQYKVSIYNADTDQVVTVLQQDFVDTIPTPYIETPAWKNFSGSFNITTSARYYLLFQIDQNSLLQNSDYMIDRVVVVAETCPDADYSDAPASYGTPSHLILGSLKLGANAPDSETTLTPLDGTGDDATGADDEDGVASFPALSTGVTSYSIPAANLAATGTGTLHAWIDFNRDGTFTAAEYKSVTVTAGTLSGPLNWTGITVNSAGTSYARFRFTSATLTDDTATTAVDERATSMAAADGEIEDYPLTIIGLDYADAPASYGAPSHLIAGGLQLGAIGPDSELTTQASTTATGDDTNGADDEDGISSLPTLTAGATSYSIPAANLSATGTGTLHAWLDFNKNGAFSSSEYSSVAVNAGTLAGPLNWSSLTGVSAGQTYLRLRFTSSTLTDNPATTTVDERATAAAANGEVEDHSAIIMSTFNPPTAPSTTCQANWWRWDSTPLGGTSPNRFNPTFMGFSKITTALGVNMWYQPPASAAAYSSTLAAGVLPPDRNINTTESFYNITYLEMPPGQVITRDIIDTQYHEAHILGVFDSAGAMLARFPQPARVNAGSFYIVSDKAAAGAVDSEAIRVGPAWSQSSNFASEPLTFTVPADGKVYLHYILIDEADLFNAALDDWSACPTDYGDAPASYGSPVHNYTNALRLGAITDIETVNTPNATATGDDATGSNDEDGISSFPTLATGLTSYAIPAANIAATGTGTLHAWIDFNKNGSFGANEYTSVAINAGTLAGPLSWTGITVGSAGNTYARFRLTSASLTDNAGTANLDERATAAASNGEVEDYALTITAAAPNYDYSDAPISYGAPSHLITSNLKLGVNTPDSEAAAQPSATATADDSNGTDDEDGVLAFPSLSVGMASYSLNVNVTNNTGSPAWLVGWIDFNGNASFDSNEAATLAVATGSTNKQLGLTWKNLSGLISGTTYARLRLTTDTNIATGVANTSLMDGLAGNGEVEDYTLLISARGYTLSGRVFHDINVNTNDDTEAGIQNLGIVLYAQASNTCIVTRTAANGGYAFSNLAAGNYTVYEVATATATNNLSACPPLADDPNGYHSTTPNSQAVSITNAAVNNINFGDVQAPIFSLDNEKSILPNTSVTYPHRFRSAAEGSVVFSIADTQADPSNLIWATTLHFDLNCDAQLNQGDLSLDSATAYAVNAGDQICLLVKVIAPANAPQGAMHSLTIQSEFTYGAGSSGIANNLQTHTDLTRTSAGTTTSPVDGTGKLSLAKAVWNVTQNIDGVVAKPGETLRYTLFYENIGNGLLDELAVHDTVPTFTSLVNGSMVCATTPTELTSCTPTANGTRLVWTFGGRLKAGSQGSVTYDVTVD